MKSANTAKFSKFNNNKSSVHTSFDLILSMGYARNRDIMAEWPYNYNTSDNYVLMRNAH